MPLYLKILIAEGKTKQAIQELLVLSNELEDHSFYNEVIIQSARYEEYAKSDRMGISNREDEAASIAEINIALLSIMEGIDEQNNAISAKSKTIDTPVEKPTPLKEDEIAEKVYQDGNNDINKEITQTIATSKQETVSKSTSWKYIASGAVFIGVLGSLANVFNLFNLFPENSKESSQLTVYVHGSESQQDYVLENAGELLVDFDGDRRYAKIGEKGRTVFNEVPAKFLGQLLPISVKATGYEMVDANVKYKFDGKPIYFEIKKAKAYREIKGMVKNEEGIAFISDVTLIIDNELDTKTDSLGRFKIQIPEDQIKDKYSITFHKNGYQTLTEFYYPNSSSEFRLLKQ